MIGRYGGCFEEDIMRLMCDRAYRIMGFGCTGEVCTNSRGEKGQCTVPKRLAAAADELASSRAAEAPFNLFAAGVGLVKRV